MKKLIVCLVVVSLLGCSNHPLENETYTAAECRTHIGEQTAYGIALAIFSTIGAIYTLGQFSNPPEYTDDQGETKEDILPGLYGLVITGGLLYDSSLCFKASSEWEGELDTITKAILKTTSKGGNELWPR